MQQKNIPGLAGRTIRCLLFDVGETLWTRLDGSVWDTLSQAGNRRATTLLRQHLNSHILSSTDETLLGEQLRAAVDDQTRSMIIHEPAIEPNGAVTVRAALETLKLPAIDTALAWEIFEALRIRIPTSRKLFDDCLATLAELQERGFLLGVVTNRNYGGPPFLEDMQAIGLLDYFAVPHIAISADLGIRKPEPAIFLHALNALGVAPTEAAMVGDSLRADIAGAQQADIFAIWKPKPQRSDRASSHTRNVDDDHLLEAVLRHEAQLYQQSLHSIKPDLIIEHLSDLLDIFIKAG